MNSASDTRPVLDAVVALCKRHACTPVFVRHIGKARREKALYAGLGSIDITAAMRSVLFLGTDPANEQRRILAQSKANNARMGPSLAYQIVSVAHDLLLPTGDLVTVEAPRLDWDGLSTLTANDLASPPPSDDEEKSALDQAREFLRDLLSDGPLLAEEVSTAAKQAGIAMRTIQRAKPLEDVKTKRRRLEDVASREWPWEWYLADEQSRCSSPPMCSVGNLGDLENSPENSTSYEDISRLPDGNLESEPQCPENQSHTLDGLDCQPQQVGRVPQQEQSIASYCPEGGAHTWILRRTLGDQLCVRCNSTRPIGRSL